MSAVINMYSKCSSINEACRAFDGMEEKNYVLWTSVVMGYAQVSEPIRALELFERMVTAESYIPDNILFTAVLMACKLGGFLGKGVCYFDIMMTNYSLSQDLVHYACIADLYARNGDLDRARTLMEEMPQDPTPTMWSSFLSSC